MELAPLFNPKSIAVIGASRYPGEPGHVILRNLLEEYKGRVWPVNPKAENIFGKKCYKSVLDVPGRPDLAVVVVPAPIVPKVLEECGKKRVRTAIIISGGFKEVGNLELEKRVLKTLQKYKMRGLGVNCIGIYDPYSRVDTIFNPKYKLERPGRGKIAFMSQSGAVGTVIIDWMAMKGYNVSKFISYGNATDIDEADLIQFLGKDNKTSVICAFFEGVKEGRKFFQTAQKLSKTKPIIALKGGITEAGARAVSSHTGSLAGSSEVYGAVFKQSGIIQADDIEELFDFARLLSTQPLPKGKRVQIITDGGGFGVLTVDWIIKYGLELAKMSPTRVKTLKKSLPPFFVVKNPIDLTGSATKEHYALALQEALADPNVDMVALIALFQLPALTPDMVDVVLEVASKSQKPIIVIAAGGRYTEVLKKSLEKGGVPCFSYPERAVKSMQVLYSYAKYKNKK